MPGLHVVNAQPVEQHERLTECRAANGKIALKAARYALLQVERGIEFQQIEPRFVKWPLLLRQ